MDAMLRIRFLKFATIGASGTLVNLGMLYLGQEYLFTPIAATGMRLNVSLALAILCATVNNFAWNRGWTWGDRKSHCQKSILVQFGQYALACWLGILLQAAFTKVLAVHCHYLVANVAAIALAGIFNFLANDLWTFALGRPWLAKGATTRTDNRSCKSEQTNQDNRP
jgi:dolichol-phosphate mannosyltransferase